MAIVSNQNYPSKSEVAGLSSIALPTFFCLFLLVVFNATFFFLEIIDLSNGQVFGYDSYIRLERVRELANTGQWFDSRLQRISPPDGLQLHWTRPLDVILLFGAKAFTPFFGFEKSLQIWGSITSVIFHGLGILAALWGASLALHGRALLIVGITYVVELHILGYSIIGRTDHHALIIFLSTLIVSLSLHIAGKPGSRPLQLIWAGAAALGIWVSVEILAVIFGCLVGWAVLWLLNDDKRSIAVSVSFTLGVATLFTCLAAFIERGPSLFGQDMWEFDRISVLHIVIAALAGGAFGFISLHTYFKRRNTFKDRFFWSVVGLLVLAVFCYSTPQFLERFFAPMSGAFPDEWLKATNELRLTFSFDRWRVVTEYLWAGKEMLWTVMAFLFLIWKMYRGAWRDPFWLTLFSSGGILVIILGLQGGFQTRDFHLWLPYVVIAFSAFVAALSESAAKALSELGAILVRVLMTIFLIFIPHGLLFAYYGMDERSQEDKKTCKVADIVPALQTLEKEGAGALILAEFEHAGLILHFSKHSVLAAHNHRFHSGIQDTIDIMTAPTMLGARILLKRRGVNYILLCRQKNFTQMYKTIGRDPTFRLALLSGQTKPWLKPVSSGQIEQAGFLLYRIEHGKE